MGSIQNNLKISHPHIADQADGWDPATVTHGSDKSQRWKCKKGHHWYTKVSHRTGGSECPYCSNLKVWSGYNDLETTHPKIAKEANGWNPKTVIAGSNKEKKLWKCERGHPFWVSPNSRTNPKNPTSCPACATSGTKKLIPGFNDFATLYPELAQDAYDWDPTECLPHGGGKKLKVKWVCKNQLCGNIFEQTRSNRIQGKGCNICAPHGYDIKKRGFLYLIQNSEASKLQIGITNNLIKRLAEHKKLGWEKLDCHEYKNGEHALDMETAIKKVLRDSFFIKGKKGDGIKTKGKTESWKKKDFDVKSLINLFKLLNILDLPSVVNE